jgi:hypothetical protein
MVGIGPRSAKRTSSKYLVGATLFAFGLRRSGYQADVERVAAELSSKPRLVRIGSNKEGDQPMWTIEDKVRRVTVAGWSSRSCWSRASRPAAIAVSPAVALADRSRDQGSADVNVTKWATGRLSDRFANRLNLAPMRAT